MSVFNRTCLALLVLIAGVWAWAYWRYERQAESNRKFYIEQVEPEMARVRQNLDQMKAPLQSPQSGKLTHLTDLEALKFNHLDEEWQRRELLHEYHSTMSLLELACVGLLFFWWFSQPVRQFIRQSQWESPNRPLALDAGRVVHDLVKSGQVFVAKSNHDQPWEVEINGSLAQITFKNFSFRSSFVRNPVRERVELSFGDLLTAFHVFPYKGMPHLSIRTTQGTVCVFDNVQPFPEMMELIQDIIELNRTDPGKYRAARAREPIVRTPWYGWLIIAAAIVGVAYITWLTF